MTFVITLWKYFTQCALLNAGLLCQLENQKSSKAKYIWGTLTIKNPPLESHVAKHYSGMVRYASSVAAWPKFETELCACFFIHELENSNRPTSWGFCED